MEFVSLAGVVCSTVNDGTQFVSAAGQASDSILASKSDTKAIVTAKEADRCFDYLSVSFVFLARILSLN